MAISNSWLILTVLAVSCGAAISRAAPEDHAREELDRAIRARMEALYSNFCRGFESGRVFDIQNEEIRFQGNVATVSYVLVVFESCEEGAPYEATREKEVWIRMAKGWEHVESCPGAEDRSGGGSHAPSKECT